MELWSDVLMNGCDVCGVFSLFFAGVKVGMVMEVMDVRPFLDLT